MRKALVKEEHERYEKIFRNSEIFLELKYQQAYLYHKHLHHDLSLKSISSIESSLKEKPSHSDAHVLAPDLQELKGSIYFKKKNLQQFNLCYERAIKLRIKQTGQFSYATASTYSNYAKFLIYANNQIQAR